MSKTTTQGFHFGHTLVALAAGQHDLVTQAQLRTLGLTGQAIAKRVRRGALHRRHHRVYSLGSGPLSQEARWHAAVLACGDGAALGYLSVAALRKVSRFRPPLIAVVSPRRRVLEGVVVHHCRTLSPDDVTTELGIPVTTSTRMLVDLSDVLTPHQLANVIHEAAFRGRFVEGAVRDAMARATGRHHLRVLERAIELHRQGSAGTRSGAEDAFLRLDLPEPRVNTHLLGREVDFHWPERRVAVEVDGAGHGRPWNVADDAQRDQTLRATGYTVLRFSDADVYRRPEEITRRTATALATGKLPGVTKGYDANQTGFG